MVKRTPLNVTLYVQGLSCSLWKKTHNERIHSLIRPCLKNGKITRGNSEVLQTMTSRGLRPYHIHDGPKWGFGR